MIAGIAEREPDAVHPEKGDGRGKGESFVAVNQSVVARERVQQGGRLLVDSWIRVLSERGRLGASGS